MNAEYKESMKKSIALSVVLTSIAVALSGCGAVVSATGDSPARPEGPVNMVVPFPPGGVDVVAKLVAPELSKALGVPVNIVNRPGNSGVTGTAEAAQAKPDGRTLLFTPQGPLAYQPFITPVSYDPEKSFSPICRITANPSILMVSEKSGFSSAKDIVAAAKAKPGQVSYSSAGPGGLPHVGIAAFSQVAGVQLKHIPAAGAAAAVSAVKSGQVDMLAEQLSLAASHLGKGIKIVAVFGETRMDELPDVPTMKEQGVNMSFQSWTALFAPAGTPKATVDLLGAACEKALASSAVRASMKKQIKSDPAFLSPTQSMSFLREEVKAARTLVHSGGLAYRERAAQHTPQAMQPKQ